jgi:hypothetical protein
VLAITVLSKDWIVLSASINLNLPFSKKIFPDLPMHLSGFQVMGYFSIAPLVPVVLIIFLSTRKQAWMVATGVMVFTGVHLINLFQLFGMSKKQFTELIILNSETNYNIIAFFVLFSFLIFISFFISKKI